MYRREFYIFATLAVFAIAFVAGATAFLMNRLNVAVGELTNISVPDFQSTGQINQRLLENWSNLLLIQGTTSQEDRQRLILEIKNNPTAAPIEDFKKTPSTPRQQAAFDKMIDDRKHFSDQRDQYFVILENADMTSANTFLDNQLIPAFQVYRKSAADLFKCTSEIANARARHVGQISKVVVWGSGLLTAFVFVAGFFTGFHSLFRGLTWANKLAYPLNEMPRPRE
jgi:hypothetical protein